MIARGMIFSIFIWTSLHAISEDVNWRDSYKHFSGCTHSSYKMDPEEQIRIRGTFRGINDMTHGDGPMFAKVDITGSTYDVEIASVWVCCLGQVDEKVNIGDTVEVWGEENREQNILRKERKSKKPEMYTELDLAGNRASICRNKDYYIKKVHQ